MVNETAVARLKRMRMRSWRRGTKEMDLLLGPYADAMLAGMGQAGLDLFDRLLAEDDPDLTSWFLGHAAPKPEFGALVDDIGRFAGQRHQA